MKFVLLSPGLLAILLFAGCSGPKEDSPQMSNSNNSETSGGPTGGTYTSDGYDCFTIRSRFNWPNFGARVESAPFPGQFDFLGNRTVADGKWHCVEMYAKLNTPGIKDGELHVWTDGVPSVMTGLEYRKTTALKIDRWWFTHWSNDAWCAPTYIDELIIATVRVGCPPPK